jgi:hypothetical protein
MVRENPPCRYGARVRSALLTLLIVALMIAVAAPSARAGSYFGVATADPPSERDFQGITQVNAKLVRFTLSWEDVQPSSPDSFDWSKFDPVVAGAAAAGVNLLPVLYGSPVWAVDCSRAPAGACQTINPLTTDRGIAGWKNFIGALVQRYGPSGSFWTDPTDAFNPPRRPIHRWQVWNEVNSSDFFAPDPRPKAYAPLLTTTADIIRAADPRARIYLAGLFGTPPKPGPSSWAWLNGLYGVPGIKHDFDEVAVHPYSPGVKGMIYQIQRARQVVDRHRDGKTPIAVTEIGWSSDKPGGGILFRGLKGQAKSLRDAFKALARDRREFGIDNVLWFSWRDPTPGTSGGCMLCNASGLLSNDYGQKPSLAAFARFTR